jgi:predicted Fe-Mo cluster-binding NifX family protein
MSLQQPKVEIVDIKESKKKKKKGVRTPYCLKQKNINVIIEGIVYLAGLCRIQLSSRE